MLSSRPISFLRRANGSFALISQFKNQKFNASTYLKGKESEPINNTIGYFLSQNARQMPYANALKCAHQNVNWSFSTLKKHAEALACGLVELGLRPGDRLALIQGMNAENIVALLACAKIGAVLVPLPDIKAAKDLTRFIELVRPRVVVSATKIGTKNYYKMIREVVPELSLSELHLPFKSKKFPFCKQILFTDMKEKPKEGTYQLKDYLVYGPFGYYETPLRRIAMELDSTNPGLILFNDKNPDKATSAVYSHKNILNAGLTIANTLGLKQGDRVMVPKYTTSPTGSIMGNFSAFVSGGVIVYPAEEYSASNTLSMLSKEQCTTLFAEPQELEELLNHADFSKNTYDHLKNVVICTPLGFDSSTIVGLLGQKLPQVKSWVVSGLEETSGILTINGKLVDNAEVKVVDGSLQVKGPLVATGKWQDIGHVGFETNEDGWVNTKFQNAKIEGNNLIIA
ncbi:hypothetical protein C9374_000667 [Naegleria lovaniensis]|uniref:AMP-dependent synthetase/ligase domain-containing protein n=1 Tax=Naegleria lovaniensis TaxID=51637 RepID=A0AA88GY42_NAELO|nr:uncharacterized protein C9374_000667 [Naegleria lovaniensis]KAG2388503.1 hypothetical protein C9374_000667 [Naegleria lovaniensis]